MQKTKKIMKWVLIPVFLFCMLFIPNNSVKANSSDSFYGKWINNIYFSKFKNGIVRSEQARIIRRNSDGQFVYCIEPGTTLLENHLMPSYNSNQASISGMSEEKWNRIQKLAYYGYGYNGRTDDKWYAITQYLIWRTNTLGWDTYFTDSFRGNIIYPFQTEIAQLTKDVDEHFIKPSFDNKTFDINVGETLTLTDSNNVLSKYEIKSTNGASIGKSGNVINISHIEKGNIKIILEKKLQRFKSKPIVYVDDSSQNVMLAGNLDSVQAVININIHGGKVEIEKTDKDTGVNKPQGESATLKGAIYGIYTENDIKVGTITTDENGQAISSELPKIGRYYLIEEKASQGYLIDDTTKYYFEITKEDLYPKIKVFEKIISRRFEFTKVFANEKTGIMTPEPNVVFGFFNSKNELVAKETTDSNGRIKVDLVYGTYIVKQLTSTPNYEKVDDFVIKVEEIGEPIYKVIANANIKAKLKVMKIDSESKEVLKIRGIKFKIFNIEEGKYVCHKISYPTLKDVCEFETDKNGEFVTPYDLKSGKYRLEEVDQIIDGYLWNNKTYEFEIGENSEIINDKDHGMILLLKYSNEQVNGKIEINKIGEELIKEDGSYRYEEIKLKDTIFNIYADEDIITKDGIVHYKKGDIVGTITTDENGYAFIDNLYLGKYYFQEIKTSNSNLQIDDKKYYFELKYKDQYTNLIVETILVKNYYKKGSLEFVKTDLSSGKTLENTIIEIYTTNDELIYTGVTDKDGKIIINDLPLGDYYILEKKAPENYKLNTEKHYFSIDENGEIEKFILTNELIIKIPNTSKNELNINFLIISGISFGLLVLIYVKKKNNKK